MEDEELQKPFGRPSRWPRQLGKGVRIGVHAPPKIHKNLQRDDYIKLLGQMAINPELELKVLDMVDSE